jgi:hypothetical protein
MLFTEKTPDPAVAEAADVELDVRALDPTSGSRALVWHQVNQRRSWEAYSACVCPVYRASYDTAASWAGVIASGWNGRIIALDVLVIAASGSLATMPNRGPPHTAGSLESTLDLRGRE